MNSFFKKSALTKLDLFILIVVAILGIVNLPYPLGDDQSLFITGAHEMARGEILYRDFWDFKPPGIFYFFYVAGSLFGFSEVGIHLLELISWLILSIILIKVFKSWKVFENEFVASLTPLFTTGIFYSLCTVYSLTQVEAIINFYLFTTLALALGSIKSENRKFMLMFFSGLTGAIVLIYKLMFLPIIGIFWLIVTLHLKFKQKITLSKIIKTYLFPLTLGFLLPIVILFIYFLKMDLLEIVYKTFFVYPPRLVTETPVGGFSKLYNLFLWYVDQHYPMLAFAVLGFFIVLWQKRNLILINIVAWFILGAIIIVLTRTSWWHYHTHLLNVPVGILFLTSIDFLWSAIKKYDFLNSWKEKSIFIIIIMILFQPALRESFGKTKFFIRYVSAKTEESKKKVIENLRSNENLYPYVYNNLDILRNPDSVPGDIYVVGVPLFYYLSGREQAVPINGWVVDLLLPEMWDQLDKQLNKNKPVYIFLDADYKKVVTDLSFQTIKFIKENYSVVSKSKNGSIWFLRNDKLEKSVVSN